MRFFIVFDLDDTLFPEADFVIAALSELERNFNIAPGTLTSAGDFPAAFDLAAKLTGRPVGEMVDFYRNCRPAIELPEATAKTLAELRDMGCGIGLLTEGRPTTQNNKIDRLGLRRYLTREPLIASPRSAGGSGKQFAVYTGGIDADLFVSVGDNPAKDFAEPRALGWLTVMLRDKGRNIHPQPASADVNIVIDSLAELPDVLKNV